MIKFFQLLFKESNIKLLDRKFQPKYFKDSEIQQEIEKNGYAVLKNIVTPEMLKFMTQSYESITQMEGFKMNELFVNSGRFESKEIRNFAINTIEHFSNKILSELVLEENCDYKNGGSFQIKPSSKKSDLNPHQDSPIIDEQNHYAVFVWVPLCDIDENNGALQVLAKSHLWGNYQRSLNVKWSFEKHIKKLKKEMQPIFLKKGDVIFFDSALIHSSLPNFSAIPRIAFNTAILPKNHQQVHYYRDQNTPEGKVEQYYITQDFYRNYNIMKKPESPFRLNEIQDWQFQEVTRKDLNKLLKLSKQNV